MELTPALVELITSILWFGLAVIVLMMFYRPLRDQVIPYLTTVNVMGVELSFVRDSIDKAIESANQHDNGLQLAEKSKRWKVEVSQLDRERVLHRAQTHIQLLQDARILWVDDQPHNNENERRMFRQLQVVIELAQSTDEAVKMAVANQYDVIVSDMERTGNGRAGLDLLERLQELNNTTPVIFYIGIIDPHKGVPPFAFGITNRPDELLHLVLDAFERVRGKVRCRP